MSLLYHLLRSNVHHDSDDDIVPVASPGTTRPSSPALRSAAAKVKHTDPLRILPTEISQCIFARLSLRDLAGCSLVSKKWNRSQTINYGICLPQLRLARVHSPSIVWFQHYRRENFHDASLPPGKWSKRESKQNWVGHVQKPESSLLTPSRTACYPSQIPPRAFATVHAFFSFFVSL